jgi:Ca2+-binding EF-hand superfamily protein
MPLVSAGYTAGAQERDDHHNRRAMRFMEIYDTGGDGKVTIKEIVADQARLFGAVDVDGDKALSVDEFRRRGRIFRSFATTTLFDLLDVNGDRKLTADEISGPSKRWFSRYDANNDGVMEAAEVPTRRWHMGRRGRGRR